MKFSSEQLLEMLNDDGVINTILMTMKHISTCQVMWTNKIIATGHLKIHKISISVLSTAKYWLSGVGSQLLEFLGLTCLKTTKVQPLLWHPSAMWQWYATSMNQSYVVVGSISHQYGFVRCATAQTARASMNVLQEMFPQYVISRGGDVLWPARSPDLSACDYILWGYLKSRSLD